MQRTKEPYIGRYNLVVDVRDYQQFSEEHFSSRILIKPNTFNYKFTYISGFFDKLL